MTAKNDPKMLGKKPTLPRSIEVVAVDQGYGLVGDGRDLRTPGDVPLRVPTRRLAEAIALEWGVQKKSQDPLSMPLTQLALTTLDILKSRRALVAQETLAYASTDCLCYRALEPEDLYQRQKAAWQPLVEWCENAFQSPLLVTRGLMPVVQPSSSLLALEKTILGHDNFHLTGLAQAVRVSGSLVLGLALLKKRLTADQVFELSELDQHYQIETWGEDPAQQSRLKSVKDDLRICQAWFDFLS